MTLKIMKSLCWFIISVFAFSVPILSQAITNEFIAEKEGGKPVLYMPWRELYNDASRKNLNKPIQKECPFCRMNNGNDDKNELILARFKHNMVALNLYPYTRGHLLIIPYSHIKEVKDMNENEQKELIWFIGEAISILGSTLNADGVNVGINVGFASGASIPDHLHVQLVPRFQGESRSFIGIMEETRPVYWDLGKLYEELQPAFQNLTNCRR